MKQLIIFIALFWTVSCSQVNHQKDAENALSSINVKDFARHLSILSSDTYQGRKPMTRGEDSTTAYIQTVFKKLKLTPAFGKSYFQEVPMVSIFSAPTDMVINIKNKKFLR